MRSLITVITKHKEAEILFLYGSLSKHFQLGADKFTLGILLLVTRKGLQPNFKLPAIFMPPELLRYFIAMQDAQHAIVI